MSNLAFAQKMLEEECPAGGGTILRKNGSKKLYVDFYYHGRRVTKSTGLNDTPANRQRAQEFLERLIERRDKGTLVFADAFPGASDDEKTWFAEKEGWEFSPDPKTVVFGEYLERWVRDVLPLCQSEGKKQDFTKSIEPWIAPYFGKKTFHQINGVELQRFVRQLTLKVGPRAGSPLSSSRIRNILVAFRAIWSDACEEHRWNLGDPLRYVARHIPRRAKRHPVVLRFSEWQTLLGSLKPHYHPVAEFMLLTGMIASEVAGLRVEDIIGDRIVVRNSIVEGREKAQLKTAYRGREIPVTEAVRLRIEAARKGREDDPYVFCMRNGTRFDGNKFRENAWTTALQTAGMSYRVPYTLRHSFAAWALTLGIHPNRLVRLMGHGSKQMVYEVYGNYVEGLEADRDAIAAYFGPDFAPSR